MTTLTELNLGFNPFKDATANNASSNLVWASMDDVKSKIERSYNDCLTNNSKQIILNWGQWGGGKTFSAFYFAKEMHGVDHLQHIYIKCPKDGAKATDELFTSVIDSISFDGLNKHIKKLIASVGDVALIDYLSPIATKEYAKAIALIGSSNSEISDTMNRFLFSGITKSELKKLGLARDIQTDSDSVKFLSGILSCYTGTDQINNGRVVIWLDEMEDLIYFAPKNYKIFSQILRDLFDTIPDRFLFFMNFTLSEGQESTIQLILGDALWSRVTKKIRYKEFSEEDALSYVKDLLIASKINKASDLPFNIDIAQALINNIPLNTLTPREINKNITSLLSYAVEHNSNNIDIHVFNEWVKDYAENS